MNRNHRIGVPCRDPSVQPADPVQDAEPGSLPLALSFPKSARLTRSSEFLRVRTEGRSWSGRFMTLGVLNQADSAKAGIIASRRVGGAVVRNKVRRRVREVIRLARPCWKPGTWMVVVIRRAAAEATFAQLQEEWLSLARRARMLCETEG